MSSASRSNEADLTFAPVHRQRLRLRRSSLAALATLGVLVALSGMREAGMIDRAVLTGAAMGMLASILLVFTLLLTGANRWLSDPSMTGLQTLLAGTVLFAVAFHATPHGHALVMLFVPVAFAFASFRFGFAVLLRLAGVMGSMALLELAARAMLDAPHPLSPIQQVVHPTALMVSLLTLAAVGGQYNDLRRRNRAERAVSHVAMSGLSEAVITVNRSGEIRFMNAAARRLFAVDDDTSRGPLLDRICHFVDREPLSRFLSDLTHRLEEQPVDAGGAALRAASSALGAHPNPASIAAAIDEVRDRFEMDCLTGQPAGPRGDHDGDTQHPRPEIIAGLIEQREGVFRYIRLSVSPLRGDQGGLEGFVLLVRDLSETRRLMDELQHAATHDSLTGLLNRRGYLAVLQQTLSTVRSDEYPAAVLAMDLDHFNMVNDTGGHEAGDALLCAVANEVAGLLPAGAALARIGGDEFGLVVRGMATSDLQALADRIIQVILEARFGRGGRMFRISASIGIARYSAECRDVRSLLARADAACRLAKQRGRGQSQIYSTSNHELKRHQSDTNWSNHIASALEDDRFALYLQEIVPAGLAEPAGDRFEVLLRMIDGNGDAIEPDAFLSAAERYGLIGAIDRHVVRKAILALADLSREGRRLPRLSINLSASSIRDATLLAWIGENLRECGIPGSQLTLELTETAAIFDLDQALVFFDGLRQLGCHIALDDVGSGFNSFANLRRLPIDQIKIDGAYVRGAIVNPIDRVMVESIQRIARVLQVETVAEFVESDDLRCLMGEISIDHLQGFAVHRPEPLAVVAQRLPMDCALA